MKIKKIRIIEKKNYSFFSGYNNEITDMSYMFYECSSLLSLPDISKWNTNKVTNISFMFSICSSLLSLPDISKWNTNNVTNMSDMFFGLKESLEIPRKYLKNKIYKIQYFFKYILKINLINL